MLKRFVRGLDVGHRGLSAPNLRSTDCSNDKALIRPAPTQPQGDLGPCELVLDLDSILARRRVCTRVLPPPHKESDVGKVRTPLEVPGKGRICHKWRLRLLNPTEIILTWFQPQWTIPLSPHLSDPPHSPNTRLASPRWPKGPLVERHRTVAR